MTDKYLILDIIQAEDYQYGEVAVVRANPVEIIPGGGMSASESLVGAEHFYLPIDNFFIQSIIAEHQQKGYWSVNPDDFRDEHIFNESENRRHLIHRHISFFDLDTDSEDCYGHIEISDIDQKYDSLRIEWIQSEVGESTSLRDYILEKATEGNIGQFWAWLFEDDALLDLDSDELDYIEDKYTNALAEFIGYCEAAETL